jgi:predicted TIM-barrel fold metal-dependent hydrolase
LQQEQDGYEFCQMAECDQRLEQYLQRVEDRSAGANLLEEKRKERRKKKKGNKPRFDLRTGLSRMTGTDLTRIDGTDVMTATTILNEAGWDMSKWKTEDHFVSWLRLCPDIKAMAAKLARLVYRMLRYGMKYVDRGEEFYEAQHRQRQIKHLKSKASKLGFQIIQVPVA